MKITTRYMHKCMYIQIYLLSIPSYVNTHIYTYIYKHMPIYMDISIFVI